MFTSALQQREAAGLRACVPLRAAALACEAAFEAASNACVATSAVGVANISSDAAAAIALAEQRLQAFQAALHRASTFQRRVYETAVSSFAAAKRVTAQVSYFFRYVLQ